jgi:Predicted transcriptional regulators
MFKIGEFSKLVRVSPRMLRHYEKCGLFYPAEIDKFTGYRLYSANQIPLLSNIVVLRDLGFSIEEIGEILPHFDEPAYMKEILRTKALSVKEAIESEKDKYKKLMEMSDSMRKEHNIMVYDVEIKLLPAIKVISLRGIIPHYRFEHLLWEKLGKYIEENQIECHNDGYSTFLDEEYMEADPDVEIAIPVDELLESEEEFVFKEYDEIPMAATIRFSGPFDGGYDEACGKLAEWLEKHGYIFNGHLRGHTIISPNDEPNPEKWLTELQVPVIKK